MIVRLLISVLPLSPFVAALDCRTLPNITPFTDAASRLYITVQMSGDSSVADLAALEKAIAEGQNNTSDHEQAALIKSKSQPAVMAQLRDEADSGLGVVTKIDPKG
jgi:hypothetical protein